MLLILIISNINVGFIRKKNKSKIKSNNDFKRSNKKKNSYKEQALEKINLSPLQTKLKYPNDKMTFSKEKFENIFDDDDSLNNIKMLKTIFKKLFIINIFSKKKTLFFLILFIIRN